MFNLEEFIDNDGEFQSYAWPGGYPLCYVTADNGTLCPRCCTDNKELIESAINSHDDDQWEIVTFEVNYEDPDLYCDNCYQKIECAYCE